VNVVLLHLVWKVASERMFKERGTIERDYRIKKIQRKGDPIMIRLAEYMLLSLGHLCYAIGII
jgi:hypothetical protein